MTDSKPTSGRSHPENDHTRWLLRQAAAGDKQAAEALLPAIYEQLRRSAQISVGQERSGHTLQATALVHEAYMRLVGDDSVSWSDRAHFYVALAEAMRRILIEHARAKARLKRGGDGRRPAVREPLKDVQDAAERSSDEILMLDAALHRLEAEDPQAAMVVRLRFFAGLTVNQTADAMGVSPSTVDRDWAYARARLNRMVRDG